MANTIWIDVEDLFEYAAQNPRPSGIQRLAFEIYSSLQQQYGDTGGVKFVRHNQLRQSLTVVPWQAVATVFNHLTHDKERPSSARTIPPGWNQQSSSPDPQRSLKRWAFLQAQAGVAFIELAAALSRWTLKESGQILETLAKQVGVKLGPNGKSSSATAGRLEDFQTLAAAGDVLLVLGSPWSRPDYAGLIKTLASRHGIRLALLIYDIIPLQYPEWCDRGLVRIFRAWFSTVMPLADTIFSISHATAIDLKRYAGQNDVRLRADVKVVPIGTGFSRSRSPDMAMLPSSRLLPRTDYALIVSTIEARKNHELLFRVWNRLLAEKPRKQVPTLVFAGRVGWLVSDLMQELYNCNWLDGKIQLVDNPTDAELELLYRGCLFTLFPSLYEGWGLPVTESLSFGKPCVISNRSSLPEAGSELARYFDPENANEAYETIRSTIEDVAGLAAWEGRIRQTFRPVPWKETASAILDGLRVELADTAPGGAFQR